MCLLVAPHLNPLVGSQLLCLYVKHVLRQFGLHRRTGPMMAFYVRKFSPQQEQQTIFSKASREQSSRRRLLAQLRVSRTTSACRRFLAEHPPKVHSRAISSLRFASEALVLQRSHVAGNTVRSRTLMEYVSGGGPGQCPPTAEAPASVEPLMASVKSFSADGATLARRRALNSATPGGAGSTGLNFLQVRHMCLCKPGCCVERNV